MGVGRPALSPDVQKSEEGRENHVFRSFGPRLWNRVVPQVFRPCQKDSGGFLCCTWHGLNIRLAMSLMLYQPGCVLLCTLNGLVRLVTIFKRATIWGFQCFNLWKLVVEMEGQEGMKSFFSNKTEDQESMHYL